MHLPKEAPTADSLDLDLMEAIFENSTVPITTEIPQESPSKPKRLVCPECQQRGKDSYLIAYQINFEEAMYLCPIQSCSYPMKEDGLIQSFVFKRDASLLPTNTLDKPAKRSRRSSGYSTFFEDFDIDTFLDFSTRSPTNVTGIEADVIEDPNDSKSDNSLMLSTEADTSGMSATNHNSQPSVASYNTDDALQCTEMQDAMEDFAVALPEIATSATAIAAEERFLLPETAGLPVQDNCVTSLDTVQPSEMMNEDKNHTGLQILSHKLSHPPFNAKMIQWTNFENSCWLDGILQVLVSNNNTRHVSNLANIDEQSLLKNIITTYDKCQNIYQEHLSSPQNAEQEIVDMVVQDLSNLRSFVLQMLKKKSSFKLGEFQSMLEMFPMILRSDSVTSDFFKVHLLWDFQCEKCGHRRARRSNGEIASIPHTLSDFHPLNAQFHRPCYECKSSKGLTTILMEKLPPCLAFHFQRGLPHSNLRVLDFAIQGHLYSVYAVVQYVLKPIKHFITWIKDAKSNKWLCCDDLKSPVCEWQSRQPKIPPEEIHMVFWERQLPHPFTNVEREHLFTVINDEASAIGEEIPLELFFAHEDETIVIPEDEQGQNDSASQSANLQSTLQANQQTDALTSTTVSSISDVSNRTMSSSQPQMNFQTPVELSSPYQFMPNAAMNVNGAVPGSYPFHPSMFANGGLTVIPNTNGRQTVQLMAPANTCSIFIVTGDNKAPHSMPLYFGTPDSRQTASARSTPCSFIDNPHSYNMVAEGVPLSTYGRKNMSKRPKRHYRLSGYSKHNSSSRFSPMKVVATAPYTSKKSSVNASDAVSEKSFNSKADSETLSEVSELSDLLPEFDLDSGSSRRSSVVTPSLPCSHVPTRR